MRNLFLKKHQLELEKFVAYIFQIVFLDLGKIEVKCEVR
jgi:hypothetical protein